MKSEKSDHENTKATKNAEKLRWLNSQQVRKGCLWSFRRKPESRQFRVFWTPAPVPDHDPGSSGVTNQKAFYEPVEILTSCFLLFVIS